MSRRALAWTAAVALPLAALAVVFAGAGWPWLAYVAIVLAVVPPAWVVYTLNEMEGQHAVDEDDWVAYMIDDMERHLASGNAEDADPQPIRPVEPPDAAPPRHRGVLGRIFERIRQIDWSDDRGLGPRVGPSPGATP